MHNVRDARRTSRQPRAPATPNRWRIPAPPLPAWPDKSRRVAHARTPVVAYKYQQMHARTCQTHECAWEMGARRSRMRARHPSGRARGGAQHYCDSWAGPKEQAAAMHIANINIIIIGAACHAERLLLDAADLRWHTFTARCGRRRRRRTYCDCIHAQRRAAAARARTKTNQQQPQPQRGCHNCSLPDNYYCYWILHAGRTRSLRMGSSAGVMGKGEPVTECNSVRVSAPAMECRLLGNGQSGVPDIRYACG